MAEAVNHPSHYGGEDNPYEVIKVIKAWARTPEEFIGGLRFNYLKYLGRAGEKDPAKTIEDLEKARWYLDYEIEYRKELARSANSG